MKQFKVLRVENEIMELFMAYGLCRILRDSEIPWTLTRKKAYYLIETEDFDYRELVLEDITMEEAWCLSPIHNNVEKEKRISNLNEFFSNPDNMEMVFSYFENPQYVMNATTELFGRKFKKETAVFSGTAYYTKGIRGKGEATSHELIDFYMHLAFLGFLSTATYVKSDAFINAVLIPKQIQELQIPFSFSSTDKETAKIKRRTYFGNDSITIVNARLYVESLRKLKSDSIIGKYDSILFMKLIPTGNKPMVDKKETVRLLDVSLDLYEQWLKWLEWSLYPEEVKYALAQYLKEHSIDSFCRVMSVLSKKRIPLKQRYLKEWLLLTPEYVQKIYEHPSIVKIGRGLHRLLYKKKGFPIQVSLLNAQTLDVFTKAIRDMMLAYQREFGYPVLTEKELQELMQIIPSDEKDISLLATAIVTYGNVLVDKNQKEKQKQGEEVHNVKQR